MCLSFTIGSIKWMKLRFNKMSYFQNGLLDRQTPQPKHRNCVNQHADIRLADVRRIRHAIKAQDRVQIIGAPRVRYSGSPHYCLLTELSTYQGLTPFRDVCILGTPYENTASDQPCFLALRLEKPVCWIIILVYARLCVAASG